MKKLSDTAIIATFQEMRDEGYIPKLNFQTVGSDEIMFFAYDKFDRSSLYEKARWTAIIECSIEPKEDSTHINFLPEK